MSRPATRTASRYRLENIPLSQISFGSRVRDPKTDPTMAGYLKELSESIQQHGLITPLCVKTTETAGSFLLMAGGCRLRALESISAIEAPCLVFEDELSDLQIKRIELEENLRRKEFTPAQEAKAYKQIHDALQEEHGAAKPGNPGYDEAKGWSLRDTAAHLGVALGTVAEAVKLAKVFEAVPGSENLWKNKTEAIKAVQKMERENERAVKVATIEKQAAVTPLELKRKALANSFIIKDFFEATKQLPDQSFDLIEVDPPYGIDLDEQRKNAESTMQHYNEIARKEYKQFVHFTIAECYKKLKENGWMIFWFGPEPHQQMVLEALQFYGFSVRNLPAIWKKGSIAQAMIVNPKMDPEELQRILDANSGQLVKVKSFENLPIPIGTVNTGGGLQATAPEYYLARAWEPFFYARKGNAKIQKMGQPDIFDFPNVPGNKRVHPTERPIELIEAILKTFTEAGSSILVPFAGSGNTILAAANYNCKAIGFDLSSEYRDGFVERVHQSEPGKYRSY